jgi:hypothetical protein
MPNESLNVNGPPSGSNHSAGLVRHLGLLKPRKVPDMSDGSTSPRQIPVIEEADLLAIFARYGVGDMVGIEGTEDRVVTLSPRSTVVCPMHEFRLVPDACRSCCFLAGEATPREG